jgi:transcriptional regulator with GAF, ATPase, and Fis domain
MENNYYLNVKSDALIELAQTLCHQNNFDEVLRLITQKAVSLLNAQIASIIMINPRTYQTMKTIFSEGKKAEERTYHPVHASISGWVLKNGRSFISEDIKSDSRFKQNVFKNIAVKSALCTPLCCEDTIIGVLILLNKNDTTEFKDSDLSYLEKLSGIVSPFLRNVQKIDSYFAPKITGEAIIKKYEAFGLIGKCKTFIELLQSVEAAARCDVRVLLEGKSGTGKELIAKAIHQCSERSKYRFIAVDCGAIPDNLMESELFGHVKGAFTGAGAERTGLFEMADNGTLFMDEITNLPLDLQTKLLRVLQEGEIRPLGSNSTRKVNVRVISAASVPLKELVHQQKFREDLFYRLLVYPIHVPSLEERQEDIPLLADHFLKQFAKQQSKKTERFRGEVIRFIMHHEWPGNIRELENFVERMVTLIPQNSRQIDIDIMPKEFLTELNQLKKHQHDFPVNKSLQERLKDYEKELIRHALIQHHWNQSSTASTLGIPESTLRYKMQKYKIKK